MNVVGHIEIYIWLLGIIACVGGMTSRIAIPSPLILVIAGMLLSFIPDLPDTVLDPDLILNVFLPLLVYAGCSFISWPEVKINLRPIAFLSIGHVIFITCLVAYVTHLLLPALPWSIAFLLGAVISPPDDVAIFAIADKIHMPQRILSVLMGESLLNDATALTLFRFALVAIATHQFSTLHALLTFIIVVVGEVLYGMVVGHLIGRLRLRISDPMLQVIVSILTPFIAYIPAVRLGGCGVLATVVASLVISHRYISQYSPDVRLLGQSVWETLSFVLQSILFLLVGLNLEIIMNQITRIPMQQLFLFGGAMTLTAIIGRFIWVFPASYFSLWLTKRHGQPIEKRHWRFPFIISWAGMRGGISLAAAMAIPHLSSSLDGVNLREFIIFITFCVITATLLIQGISLPYFIRKLGLNNLGIKEHSQEQLSVAAAKLQMINAVLEWLTKAKATSENKIMYDELNLQTLSYETRKAHMLDMINSEDNQHLREKMQHQLSSIKVQTDILDIERTVLTSLWHTNQISARVRNRLMRELDLHHRRLAL